MPYDSLVIQTAIAANTDKSSAQIAAMYPLKKGRKPDGVYITYRTIAAVIGQAKMEQVGAFYAANAPKTDAMLSQFGPTDGTSGGVDITRDDARAAIDSLPKFVDGVTADDAIAIKALGEIDVYEAGGPITAADVDFEKVQMTVDAEQAWFNTHAMLVNAAYNDSRRTGVIPTRPQVQSMVDPKS